jgi:hypothetical protein
MGPSARKAGPPVSCILSPVSLISVRRKTAGPQARRLDGFEYQGGVVSAKSE